MKNLLLTILGMILIFPSISKAANEEVVWELEGVWPGIEDIIVSNTQDVFYNTYYGNIQVRSVNNGQLLDSIVIEEFKGGVIDKISITNDDRFLAISGNIPHIIVWDIVNKQIYKKLTKIVYDGDKAHTWKSASISPDGTKLTAIAIIEPAGATELVIFDIETEEVILSEFRQSNDQINYEYYTPIWVSTAFSPSGDYLVTELSINWTTKSGERRFYDSVYVYNTINYIIESTFLNAQGDRDISFSPNDNVISSVFSNLSIYNLDTRETQDIILESRPHSVLFSRMNSSKILLSIGTRTYIYDYTNKKESYSYVNNISAIVIAKEDSKLIGFSENGLICLNTFWTTTLVESNSSPSTFYPNPVNNLLNIKFNVNNGGEFKYDLFDINSNKIASKKLNYLQKGENDLEINFQTFPPQTYFLKIYSPFESFTYKIVKE